MKWESDLGDLIAVPKSSESPWESAPSFSLLPLTPGKFEMNVSDRTELAHHLHKIPTVSSYTEHCTLRHFCQSLKALYRY